jgi:hypothetical protein
VDIFFCSTVEPYRKEAVEGMRILLYGNSVILGTIKASLKRCSGFKVTTMKLPQKQQQPFDACKPDILAFDLHATQTEEVLSFLKINPAMLLIGVSPDINMIKIWTIREVREATMQDLLQVIMSEAKNTPVDSSGKGVRPHQRAVKDKALNSKP